ALAQDLVQEALVKTYVAWPRLRDPGDPAAVEAYARRVVTTTAIGWMRRKGWHAEQSVERLPEHADPADHADHADAVATGAVLWAALRSLPPRQRVAVVLRYYDDLTEAQTAAAMGCAVGTVKSQVSAALRTLRAAVGDELRIGDLR